MLCEVNGSNYGLAGFAQATGISADRDELVQMQYGPSDEVRVTSEMTGRTAGRNVLKLDVWASWCRRALHGNRFYGEIPSWFACSGNWKPVSWEAFIERAFAFVGPQPGMSGPPHAHVQWWCVHNGVWLFPTPLGDVLDVSTCTMERGRALYDAYLAHPAVCSHHDQIKSEKPVYWNIEQDGYLVPWGTRIQAVPLVRENVLDDVAAHKDLQKPLHPATRPFAVYGKGQASLLSTGHTHYVVKPIDGCCGTGVQVVSRAHLRRNGVPPNHIAEPLFSPRGDRVRVLRCGLVVDVVGHDLCLTHVGSYWRENPRPFDPNLPESVITNLSRDAVPRRMVSEDVPAVCAWLRAWGEHLRVMWGLDRVKVRADFTASVGPAYVDSEGSFLE